MIREEKLNRLELINILKKEYKHEPDEFWRHSKEYILNVLLEHRKEECPPITLEKSIKNKDEYSFDSIIKREWEEYRDAILDLILEVLEYPMNLQEIYERIKSKRTKITVLINGKEQYYEVSNDVSTESEVSEAITRLQNDGKIYSPEENKFARIL